MARKERVIDRIRGFLELKGISAYEFERKVEVANGYVYKQNIGKGTVGSDTLEKIYKCYPSLNIIWLITGEGEMEVDKEKDDFSVTNPGAGENESSLLIQGLKDQVAFLRSSNADKEKIIAMLEEKVMVLEKQIKEQ